MKKCFFIIFLLITASFLQSCKVNVGYGVVLWSSDTVNLQTGSVVKIRSKITKNDIYRVENEDRKVLEVETWRLQSFKSKGQAKKFATKYAFYINNYVEGQLDGLPMRETATISADIVYKIANEEVLKVIGRTKEREEIGPYKGYWYNLLASDGTKGWVFGRFLKRFILSNNGDVYYEENQYLGNSLLERFFDPSISWRPIYFRNMINNKQINLDLFNAEYGLFIDDTKKTIKIKMPEHEDIFTYTKITPVGGDNYHFDGSTFSFSLGQKETVARFTRDDKKVMEVFYSINKNGGLLSFINEEQKRREAKYSRLKQLETKRGEYGEITFIANGNFTLKNYSAMVNNGIILSTSGSNGHIDMDIFLSGSLAKEYSGGFTMTFMQDKKEVSFLYKFINGGIELTMIENLPRDKILGDKTKIIKQEVMVFY